jgi:hypothetical protein
MARKIKSYWWTRVPNFGDGLSPLLLSRFSNLTPEWSPVEEASIVSIGSILEHIPPNWGGFILGSGKLRETSILKFSPKDVKILSLRGPLSAKGIPGDYPLGDPGVLANELVGPQEKLWDLGIVPHWQDDELADRFLKLIPSKFSCRVISPSSDPLTVVREIGACKRIVTSSLHGMIVADSFGGIPRRVESCDKMNVDGGLFKFKDYSASIKTEFEIGKMIEPSRFRVEDIKFNIYDAYRQLGGYRAQNLRDL